MINKEQWVFILALALLGYGVYSITTNWMPEKKFVPPAINRKGGGPRVEPLEMPLFSAEDEVALFRERGRDPFQPNRETEPLPLARLEIPPRPALARVAPGPEPGLGASKMRPLEEPVPPGEIDLQTPAPGEEGEGEEEEDDDEWGRRRW
jgi:hypothetical protein